MQEYFRKNQVAFSIAILAGLDLSGSPDFANPITEKFEPCDRDGLSNVDLSGLPSTNHLKQFVNQPDMETLARVAKETGDQQLIERVKDEWENTEAKAFMAANPSYYRITTTAKPSESTRMSMILDTAKGSKQLNCAEQRDATRQSFLVATNRQPARHKRPKAELTICPRAFLLLKQLPFGSGACYCGGRSGSFSGRGSSSGCGCFSG